MKPSPHVHRRFLTAALLIGLMLALFPAQAGETPAKARPKDIYDVKADGKEQIARALEKARDSQRRVLLQFGANWCGWCHRLHRLFETDQDIAANLKQNYVVVLIDVDGDHNADVVAKYDRPTQYGLPVIVVLDADGKKLTTKNTAELEEGDHHDPKKVMAFLNKWAPPKKSESATGASP